MTNLPKYHYSLSNKFVFTPSANCARLIPRIFSKLRHWTEDLFTAPTDEEPVESEVGRN